MLAAVVFQARHIRKVLGPARGTLAADQVGSPQDLNREPLDINFGSIGPCSIEVNAVNGGHDIDSARCNTDLEDDSRSSQVFLGYVVKGCTKASEGSPRTTSVLDSWPNPEVHVTRCPRESMRCDGVGAHKKELNPLLAEGGQHVAVIGIEQWVLL